MLEFGPIDGWFNFSDLYKEMVDKAPENATFVELGVFKGLSASQMSSFILASGKKINFHAIDWFKGSIEHKDMNGVYPTDLDVSLRDEWMYQHCLENLKPAIDSNLVNVIRMNAKDAVSLYADNSIDFCFHDASHEYEDLIEELPMWWNKIKPGGYFGGHDYGNWSFIGVGRAVNKLAEQYNLHITYRAREDSWLVQKPIV